MLIPKISYHGGHSGEFCNHARDSLAEIVARYQQLGFSHLGLVEHLPAGEDWQRYPDELGQSPAYLQSRFRRLMNEVRPMLLKTYDQKIIHLAFGIESEWFGESAFYYLAENIRTYKPDFVVASVHHVSGICVDYSAETFAEAVAKSGGLDKLWLHYFDSQMHLVQLLRSTFPELIIIIGHFDLPRLFAGDYQMPEQIISHGQFSIGEMIRLGCVFDLNTRAIKKELRTPYPDTNFLKFIASQGGKVTLGDDSHGISDVGLGFEHLAAHLTGFKSICAIEKDTHGQPQLVQINLV